MPSNRKMSWSTTASELVSTPRGISRARPAVEEDLARPRLVEAGDQLRDGGLAAARAADQRDARAGLERQVEVLDQRRVEPAVAEGDVAQLEVAGELDRRGSGGRLARRPRDRGSDAVAQHVVEPVHVALDLLQRAAEAHQPVDRRR